MIHKKLAAKWYKIDSAVCTFADFREVQPHVHELVDSLTLGCRVTCSLWVIAAGRHSPCSGTERKKADSWKTFPSPTYSHTLRLRYTYIYVHVRMYIYIYIVI